MDYHKTPTTWLKYYKKASLNGLYAHLYEHVIAARISDYMYRAKQLLLVDFDFWAHVMNRTIILDARLHTDTALHAFEEALLLATSREITLEECEKAVRECSCEYERLYSLDGEVCTRQLNKLKVHPWVSVRDFTFDAEDSAVSVQNIFEASGIKYGRRSPRSFAEITIEYIVPEECFKTKPQLMPLAMVLVQAIAKNQIVLTANNIIYYDTGDDWDEGAPRVAYQHYMLFAKKQLPNLKYLKEVIGNNNELLLNNDFIKKTQRLLRHNYAYEPTQYFFDKDLYSTTGVIMGIQGWAEIAAKENIDYLLSHLSIKLIGQNDKLTFPFFLR